MNKENTNALMQQELKDLNKELFKLRVKKAATFLPLCISAAGAVGTVAAANVMPEKADDFYVYAAYCTAGAVISIFPAIVSRFFNEQINDTKQEINTIKAALMQKTK